MCAEKYSAVSGRYLCGVDCVGVDSQITVLGRKADKVIDVSGVELRNTYVF